MDFAQLSAGFDEGGEDSPGKKVSMPELEEDEEDEDSPKKSSHPSEWVVSELLSPSFTPFPPLPPKLTILSPPPFSSPGLL